MAAWGEQEDDPDYVCSYQIPEFERPWRLVFSKPIYHSRDGSLPDSLGDVRIVFTIEMCEGGSKLHVSQSGIPESEKEFCEGCRQGWETTLDQLRTFLTGNDHGGRV